MSNKLDNQLLYQIGDTCVAEVIDIEMASELIKCPDSLGIWFKLFHKTYAKGQRKNKRIRLLNKYGKKVALLICG